MIWTVLICAVLALFYLFLAHLGWRGLHIDHEVKPIDVISVLVNVTIAIVLQYFLLSRSGNMRVEKDLIIEDAKSVVARLRQNNESFLTQADNQKVLKSDWSNSVSQCRAIANALDHLKSSLQATDCKKCKKLDAKCNLLKQHFFKYKAAVTSDAPGTEYNAKSIRSQAREFRFLLKEMQGLIFGVNRH